jgi:amidase
MADLSFRRAVDLAAAIRKREVSSAELLDHYLARVERLNPKLNAVVTLDVERARKRAREADQALARGEVWGPLHGLPMTVKDTIETAGVRTTAGATVLAEHVPAADAVTAARLVAAGAIIFGKTNTPTFAGDAQSYNPVFGTTNNPWDPSRTCGGSSGGSAVAMAAGLSALELGSDIGGSVRNPAHFCGVYALKPSYRIVPSRGHIPGPPGTLSDVDIAVLGPIARSADDLDLALGVLAGPDDAQKVGWRLELPPPRRQSLRDYRVAAWLDDPACPVDRDVLWRLEATVEALRKAGVKVDDRARPALDFAAAYRAYQNLLWPIMTAGLPPDEFATFASLADSSPARSSDPEVAFAQAMAIRHRDWIAVNEEREQYRTRWAELFRDYDVLLCPVVPVAAFPHDHSEPMGSRTILVNGAKRPYLDLIAWAGLIGMAYLPAAAAPVGRTPSGLPVGVQIVGPYLEDRTTIDFARRLGEVIGGFEPPPGY